MPRSHHRKKHRQHVQQFKHSYEATASPVKAKGNATGVFTFAGIAVGALLGYLASTGSFLWAGAGLIAGAAAGYLIGHRIDRNTN